MKNRAEARHESLKKKMDMRALTRNPSKDQQIQRYSSLLHTELKRHMHDLGVTSPTQIESAVNRKDVRALKVWRETWQSNPRLAKLIPLLTSLIFLFSFAVPRVVSAQDSTDHPKPPSHTLPDDTRKPPLSPQLERLGTSLFGEFLDEFGDEPLMYLPGAQVPETFLNLTWKDLNPKIFRTLQAPFAGEFMTSPDAQFGTRRSDGIHAGVDVIFQGPATLVAPFDAKFYDGWDTQMHTDKNPRGGMGRMIMLLSDVPIMIEGQEWNLMLVFGHIQKEAITPYYRTDGSEVEAGTILAPFGMSGNTDELHAHTEGWLIPKGNLPDDFGKRGRAIERPEGTVIFNMTDLLRFLFEKEATAK